MEVTDVSIRALPFIPGSLKLLALGTLKQHCGEAHVLKKRNIMSDPEPEPPQI